MGFQNRVARFDLTEQSLLVFFGSPGGSFWWLWAECFTPVLDPCFSSLKATAPEGSSLRLWTSVITLLNMVCHGPGPRVLSLSAQAPGSQRAVLTDRCYACLSICDSVRTISVILQMSFENKSWVLTSSRSTSCAYSFPLHGIPQSLASVFTSVTVHL